MDETPVTVMVRHYHHSNHGLDPMEECEELGCRLQTGRIPSREDNRHH